MVDDRAAKSSWVPGGPVFGVLPNQRATLAALGGAAALQAAPYQSPPRAPVLYVKTANCCTPAAGREAAIVALPPGAAALRVGPTLALVLGRSLRRASVDEAAAAIAGYVLVADLSLPEPDLFRPPVRARCADGLLPHGEACVALDAARLDGLRFAVAIDDADGAPRPGATLTLGPLVDWLRGPADLLADISAFMTLPAGSALLPGLPGEQPLAGAGCRVAIEVPSVPELGRLRLAIAGTADHGQGPSA
jgi:5-oxopent-3-ene-1,2,5-tricarboxylate decarboxylase/2-hydroxyhepta-2,4-diene-1,7-dioate isomerase